MAVNAALQQRKLRFDSPVDRSAEDVVDFGAHAAAFCSNGS